MFVIDISKLSNADDVKKDNFGKWKHLGSHQSLYHVKFGEDGEIDLEKCAPGASGDDIYYLRRLYSSHPSNPAFRRILAFLSGLYVPISIRPCPCLDLHSTAITLLPQH